MTKAPLPEVCFRLAQPTGNEHSIGLWAVYRNRHWWTLLFAEISVQSVQLAKEQPSQSGFPSLPISNKSNKCRYERLAFLPKLRLSPPTIGYRFPGYRFSWFDKGVTRYFIQAWFEGAETILRIAKINLVVEGREHLQEGRNV